MHPTLLSVNHPFLKNINTTITSTFYIDTHTILTLYAKLVRLTGRQITNSFC